MSNTDRAMGPESPVTTGISRKGLSVGTVGVLGALRHHKHLFDDLPTAIGHARDHVRRERCGPTP